MVKHKLKIKAFLYINVENVIGKICTGLEAFFQIS
jgi:hypothetical protein